MADEYITKKQAQDILCRGCNKDLHLICRCDKWAEIRRADGIEIVYCKDCKHRNTFGIDAIDCRHTPDYWFCADGERKDDN